MAAKRPSRVNERALRPAMASLTTGRVMEELRYNPQPAVPSLLPFAVIVESPARYTVCAEMMGSIAATAATIVLGKRMMVD